MFESQITRTDVDLFVDPATLSADELGELLRPHLTVSEARQLGISVADTPEGHKAGFNTAALAGLGATVSTMALFTLAGVLATLGLPDTSHALALAGPVLV